MRRTSLRDGNGNTVHYSRNAAGDLLALTDGKGQVTQWKYDVYGRATNKIDAANVTNFVYKYDANDRLTNRWTPGYTKPTEADISGLKPHGEQKTAYPENPFIKK